MRARSRVVVDAGGRLAVLDTGPPLTVRRVRDPDPGVCALCLVGTAAGPLPGDDLALALDVGARATLVATGAQLAQGGPPGRPPARMRFEVRVAAGAALTADPGPLVVTAGADVEVDVAIDLAADATLCWTETLVLGRVGERPGRAVLRWDVRRAGAPLLRQDVDLRDPALRDWPGLHAGATTVTTTLVVGPQVDAATVVRGAGDVTQRLAGGATLRTRLTTRAATAD